MKPIATKVRTPGMPPLNEIMAEVPGLTREDILHWYLSAVLLRVGGNVRITFEELAQVKAAKIRHDVIDHAVELRVEVAP